LIFWYETDTAQEPGSPLWCHAVISLQFTHVQSRISRPPHSPNWGNSSCHRGLKIHSRHHLAHQTKLQPPKLNYETLEIIEAFVNPHSTVFRPVFYKHVSTCRCYVE